MADGYDRHIGQTSGRFARYVEAARKRAVAALQLRAGGSVLDVGCGTGASFARLVAAVGEAGRVIGVDQSPAMLDVAARRVAAHGWANVELVEGAVGEVELPRVDAALFFLVHDLVRTPEALDAVVRAVEPGGRVATAGVQRPPAWLGPIALAAPLVMRRYTTTTAGLARPWDLLADRLDDVASERLLLGAMYVVSGRAPAG